MFKELKSKLDGKKTYIAALGALLTAVGGYLTGEVPAYEATQLAFTAIIGAFLRSGVAKQ